MLINASWDRRDTTMACKREGCGFDGVTTVIEKIKIINFLESTPIRGCLNTLWVRC